MSLWQLLVLVGRRTLTDASRSRIVADSTGHLPIKNHDNCCEDEQRYWRHDNGVFRQRYGYCHDEVSSLHAALHEFPDCQARTRDTACASPPGVLANPQRRTRDPQSAPECLALESPSAPSAHARYNSVDIISQGHALSQNSRPDALVMPSTASPHRHGWLDGPSAG